MFKILKAGKKFFRRFNVVNITLLILCSLLTFAIVKIWTPSNLPEKNGDAIKVSQAEIKPPVEVESASSVPAASYESIPLKNLFRPNRKEWETLPPSQPPPPQPPPELKLHGVIILGGDKNVAIISGSYLDGANKVDLKAQRFKINQLIANYRITEITKDKTILKKEGGEDVLIVPLIRGGIRADLLTSIKNQTADKDKKADVISLSLSSGNRTTLIQPSDDGIVGLSKLEAKFSISDIRVPQVQSPPQHISGAATTPVPTIAGDADSTRPAQHISGVVTQPPAVVIGQGIGVPPPQHISGDVTGR
jgi:hypothetical protein